MVFKNQKTWATGFIQIRKHGLQGLYKSENWATGTKKIRKLGYRSNKMRKLGYRAYINQKTGLHTDYLKIKIFTTGINNSENWATGVYENLKIELQGLQIGKLIYGVYKNLKTRLRCS